MINLPGMAAAVEEVVVVAAVKVLDVALEAAVIEAAVIEAAMTQVLVIVIMIVGVIFHTGILLLCHLGHARQIRVNQAKSPREVKSPFS